MDARPTFSTIKESDLKILSELRDNSRQTLAEISRKTRISISTVYDRIKFHENDLIKRNTCMIDFQKLGYGIRTSILASANEKDEFRKFAKGHPNINSAFEIDNDFNFLLDCVFPNMSDCRDFVENLEKNGVEKSQVHYIIDEVKVESFMSAKSENKISETKKEEREKAVQTN
ncbi:Lrp/AsnC family transcriptional regulator [Candidatus Woesearchaeota archaeon]|jgi:Lrp/AsnC family transcriptional regulator, leucine-responsive regulatory protein|nr:Lrp/AsnC family transcriptional regulator [Candidatus Woesearchaeota archaeon]MBT5271983.1 Lrp/AsnC family transcriptional regulator [Candidatus Woesearchaeota archaeon]MBT6040897.1 Lrp/AsnC family transcriptional regulator [Candidatus Woesearchaeota archaeon]MBT6336765.1 Lrp/AsnC family transcriptional regulator [Candidatus Woesearchaeota archaeon]MBT7927214.1 Lrp/AsnC family transcriptional regulator [Candidatus Woesearchaeota archaeon]